MSWWGKILGGLFGYLADGYVTAVLGALLGHALDTLGVNKKKSHRRHKKNSSHLAKANYFSSTFSIMGHVSKVDGHVSAEEIRVATMVMDQMGLTKPQREKAISLFNDGKNSSFPLDEVLVKLRSSCRSQKNLLRMFLEIQVMAALADGDISDKERRLLQQISERLGILRMEYQRIEDRVRITMNFTRKKDEQAGSKKTNSGDTNDTRHVLDAYTYLDLTKDASDREVKKAYRLLLSQHHPDKLLSKGLPEEMMKLATQKTHEIRKAYEIICKSRGI